MSKGDKDSRTKNRKQFRDNFNNIDWSKDEHNNKVDTKSDRNEKIK